MHRLLLCAGFPIALLLSSANAQDLPEGTGKRLVQEICSGCHGLDSVTSQRATRQGWADTIDYMIQRGATAKDDEIKLMTDYLAKNFGAKTNVNKASAKDLAFNLELTAEEGQAIVDYRKANGNFKDWESLAKVPNVDSRKLEQKRDSISF
jgi:competence ComEA-like helix-hairpin-helix protein